MEPRATQLIDLVGSMYEAAFEEPRWTDVIRRCTSVVGGAAGSFYCLDFGDKSALLESTSDALFATHGIDDASLQAYAAHYTYTNVWQDAEDRMPEGAAVTSSMLFPDGELVRTEFYGDWLRPQGLFFALGGVVSRQGTMAAKASILRPRSLGCFDNDDLRLWEVLVGHLHRALELRKRVQVLDLSQAVAFGAMDRLAQGVMLLSPTGQIIYKNTLASSLSSRRGLTIDASGSLIALDRFQDKKLQRLIKESIETGCSKGLRVAAGCSLGLWGPAGQVHLFVAPLLVDNPLIPIDRCAAVVFLTDPESKPPDLSAMLSSLYKMTPAEGKLTSALASGVSLRDYAQARCISINTVRSQLKSAASKVGAKRQADLVRIVLTGPAVLHSRRQR